MKENNFLPVNWTDGMKINKTHFIAQDNAMRYMVADGLSSFLNGYNYGLLPWEKNSGSGSRIFLSTDNQQQVTLRLQRCRAVTQGGYLINVEEDTSLTGNNLAVSIPALSVAYENLKGNSKEFYIVVAVSPYERVPQGVSNPKETPPRLPFTDASYSLHLVPVAETNKNTLGLFQLPVGKLKVDEQKVSLDENYIAPSHSVSSHSDLLEIHAGLEQFFGKMELYSLQIMQKIFQKKQQNDMAVIVQKMCENLLIYTAAEISNFKLTLLHQPPVLLVNAVAGMARLMKNTIDMYTGSGKEELINYFTEWCDVNQGELEGSITELSNHQYDHLDINTAVIKVTNFTRIISHLFANLARLDYIGKRRDAGIFVKEQIVSDENDSTKPKRRSFLAD